MVCSKISRYFGQVSLLIVYPSCSYFTWLDEGHSVSTLSSHYAAGAESDNWELEGQYPDELLDMMGDPDENDESGPIIPDTYEVPGPPATMDSPVDPLLGLQPHVPVSGNSTRIVLTTFFCSHQRPDYKAYFGA